MDEPSQIPTEKKKTKSDIIRSATFQEYVEAQSKGNGHPFRGFFHSNLFVALLLWSLSQGVVLVGFVISYIIRTSQLAEWKGQTEATLKRMDETGTTYGHYNDQREDRDIADLQARMKKSEEEGRHWEVIETEHRHLVEDVYDLRHPKK